jgi:hypothetical protein
MNTFTQFLVWSTLSYGLMNIIVFGSIFKGFREFLNKWASNSLGDYPFQGFGKFLSNMVACPMCFSVWGGFFLSFVVWSPLNLILNVDPLFSWFFDGVLSSGVVWAINSIIEWFEENRPNSKN